MVHAAVPRINSASHCCDGARASRSHVRCELIVVQLVILQQADKLSHRPSGHHAPPPLMMSVLFASRITTSSLGLAYRCVVSIEA